MKIQKFNSEEEWEAARLCKITGTRLKDIVTLRGTGKKKGYYELIAERLAIPGNGQDPMERGKELEAEALERFTKETGKKVDNSLVLWMRDDNENIAVSPDGQVIDAPEACEVKCLNSASHIEALLKNDIPDDYRFQRLQYFIVNENLQKLYFIFYDPRMSVKDFFFFEVKREDIQDEIDEYLEHERKTLEEIESIVTKLSF